jgi:hypothetical protein
VDETRRTCSLRIAGACIALGCTLEKSEKGADGKVIFLLSVPSGISGKVAEAVKMCQDGGFGVMVDLGFYERARNVLRDELDKHEGGPGRHERRRT